MTYAEVAGLSPVNGLYALLLPTVLYVLLGSSRQLIVGPEGSISTLVGAAILPLAVAGSAHAGELAAMLAVLVAICFAVAWTLRLGWIADYFSRAVLLGYIHGVAVVLVICQVGRLFGVSIAATNPLKLPLAAVLARVVGLVAVAGILRGDQALVPRAARNLLVDARCGWPIAV
jgi:MFS superfamily sulfate permease-like transporter